MWVGMSSRRYRQRLRSLRESAERSLGMTKDRAERGLSNHPRPLGCPRLAAVLGRSLPHGSLRSPFGHVETLTPFASRAVRSLRSVHRRGHAERPRPSSPPGPRPPSRLRFSRLTPLGAAMLILRARGAPTAPCGRRVRPSKRSLRSRLSRHEGGPVNRAPNRIFDRHRPTRLSNPGD